MLGIIMMGTVITTIVGACVGEAVLDKVDNIIHPVEQDSKHVNKEE